MNVIVWDIDDVLNDLMRIWLETYWRPTHAECILSYDQVSENPPHRLLKVSLYEYLASLDNFRQLHYASMVPRPGVLDWFRRYGDRFRHMALTATPLFAAAISAAWVMNHFGRWIRSFHLVPSRRSGDMVPTYDRSKAEFLRWWDKSVILVEDSPKNADAAIRQGSQAILLPRPWNQGRFTETEALEHLANLA